MAFTYAGQYTEALVATGSSGATLLPSLPAHVYTVGTTTHVTLYTSRTKGSTTANPVSTDVNGNLTFFADPGQYDIVFTPTGGSAKRVTVTVPLDPAEPAATYEPGGRSTGRRNRPRKAIPSFQSFVRLGQVTKNDATWKGQYCGIGMDVFWDPHKQQHAMIFCGSDSGTGTTKFGIAWSDDLLTWTEYGSNPIFGNNPTGGQPDSGAVTFPQVFIENNTIYMYYVGFPTAGYEIGTPSLCYATAPLGSDLTNSANWTRHGAVITTASFPGAASIIVMYRPNVSKVGATYYLFCNAGPAIGDEDVWCFSAPAITGPWTRVQDTPVVSGDDFTTDTKFADPEVIRFDDQFVMLGWHDAGVIMAYCDATEFPTTWHPSTTGPELPGFGITQRPVWIEGPSGPLVYVNANGSTTIDIYRPAGWGDYAVPRLKPLVGRYTRANGVVTTAPTGAGDGYMTLAPLTIDRAAYLTSLSVQVTTSAASSAIRFGLYLDDGHGVPLTLVNGADFGTVASTSTGIKTKSGLNISLAPGLYWMAVCAQGGAPNLTGLSTVAHDTDTSATLADLFNNFYGWYTTAGGISGSFPASLAGLISQAANPIPLCVAGF